MKDKLLAQRRQVFLLAQQSAEDLRKFVDHLAGFFGILANQGGHGVQRIEQKVRIDLAAERGQAGFVEAQLLQFQFALVALAVPDFDGQHDG